MICHIYIRKNSDERPVLSQEVWESREILFKVENDFTCDEVVQLSQEGPHKTDWYTSILLDIAGWMEMTML